MALNTIVNAIAAAIIAMTVSSGASGMAEVSPDEAATAFLDGMKSGNMQVIESYVDNRYVNALVCADSEIEEEGLKAPLTETVFSNMSYEIEESAIKGNIAVVRVNISNIDYSEVMEDYEKASYKYVMDNLYEKDIEDKDKLSAECLNIYMNEIAKKAKSGEATEKEVYIPMESDGYCGWRVILNDEIMQAMLGELSLPTGEEK